MVLLFLPKLAGLEPVGVAYLVSDRADPLLANTALFLILPAAVTAPRALAFSVYGTRRGRHPISGGRPLRRFRASALAPVLRRRPWTSSPPR